MSDFPKTALKAIRAKCLNCSNNQFIEVRRCPVKRCPLWGYRTGHKPKGNKTIDEDSAVEKTAKK